MGSEVKDLSNNKYKFTSNSKREHETSKRKEKEKDEEKEEIKNVIIEKYVRVGSTWSLYYKDTCVCQ